MENNKKELDFQGQTIYVGIDVHKQSWKVSIHIGGLFIKVFSMNPNPQELVNHLRKNYPNGLYKTVYEAGFCGYRIDRELREAGISNIVVNPADIPTSNKEKSLKNDVLDSKKLSRELSNGHLRGIYIPSIEQESLRGLSRLRIQLTKDQTRLKNRIKSLLNFTGVEFPENYELKHWSRKFIDYLYQLEFSGDLNKIKLHYYLDNLLYLRGQLVKVVRELRGYIKTNKEANEILNCLQSVAGIGFIIGITYYTEIMDIRRFNTVDKLSSFVGLIPSTHSSGQKETVLGITKRQNKYLRSLIIEAAWAAVRVDSALTQTYGELSKRMGKQEAIIRIARKLLNRIMYVWKNKTQYKFSVVQ